MDDKARVLLKHLIRSQIKKLENILGESEPTAEKKTKQADDASANLDLTIAAQVEEKLVQLARVEILQLRQNLKWLDSDDAGYCDDCGCEVPLDRLIAVPTTRLCIDCAEKVNEGKL